MELLRRFWMKVSVRPWDCWEWAASVRKDGYGRFLLNGEATLAHLVAYRCLVGPIPADLALDHLCRNRRCVNPEHLEPVTDKVNILRGNAPAAINSRKTHCQRGHPLKGDNLGVDSTGRRRCKKCKIESDKKRYWRLKEED
jgi:hypothetical protein